METEIVFRGTNGQAITNSLLVAETFGKHHYHVIDSIKSLLHSHEKSCQFYESATYEDGSGKKNRMYLMNRDGFTLLAMGFNGKKALDFKIKYIEAFNRMEQQLRQGTAYSIENLSRKQILQMALEAEEEKERMAARLAFAENRNSALQASVENLLPRLESLEKRMDSREESAATEYRIPKGTGKKRCGLDPRKMRKQHPEYSSSREVLKWLKAQGIRIKNFEFYAFLRENGFVSRDDETYNMPTDLSVENGWMLPVQSGTCQTIDGRRYYTPYFSPDGKKHILYVLREVKLKTETPLFAES